VGEIAEQLLVSVSYVSQVLGRERRTGERTVRPQRGHVTPKLAAYHDTIREHVLANPDVTLAELQAWHRFRCDQSPSAYPASTIVASGLPPTLPLKQLETHWVKPNGMRSRSAGAACRRCWWV
jgi:hypothetical protein